MRTALLQEIDTKGPLRFRDFMEFVLYRDPGGYYARPDATRVGREGDFITSVSIGPVFGMLLAERVAHAWRQAGAPPRFALVEPGPESGQLAHDLCHALASRHPACLTALVYHLIEPAPAKHESLRERTSSLPGGRAMIHCSASEVGAPFGIVIANEILDALPVHLLERRHGGWMEKYVTISDGAFAFTDRECTDPALLEVLSPWSEQLPEGYTTEVCLDYEPYLASLTPGLERAVVILIDYGFSSEDYYQPARTSGTLRVYRRHKAGNDPLADIGECDLTAHVDFSRVLLAAGQSGLTGHAFHRQEQYLTHLAAPLLTDPASPLAGDPALIRQFRTLTHPALPGGRFHVLELTKSEIPLETFPYNGLPYLRE